MACSALRKGLFSRPDSIGRGAEGGEISPPFFQARKARQVAISFYGKRWLCKLAAPRDGLSALAAGDILCKFVRYLPHTSRCQEIQTEWPLT
jgi:hypothetical protein